MAKKIVDETLKFNILINGDDAKKEYGQLERANRKFLDANEDLEKQAKALKKANKENTDEYKQLRAEIDQNAQAVTKNKSRMGELTDEIGLNNLTMRQLRKEYGKLNGILNNLDPNSPEWAQYNAQLKEVKGRMSELRGEMQATEQVMNDQIDILGQFGAGFAQIFTGLKSGNYKEASAGFQAIGSGIKGATKAALAFIATPIGATLAVLAGIGFIVKEWLNYNESIKESIILTEQITRLQGEQAESIRLRNEALKTTFGTDEKEQLETARNLVEQFGISYDEAFDTIEAGLVRGQKNNNEYFDSLREYPAFFSAAEYSAEEFRNVIEAGYNLGIYNDKLPDAIKEFNISIQEQTKATREALINAFGKTFTDDLLQRVKTGETSTKDALQEVSKESERLGLNIEQNQRLTADVFRGAGEDAGGAIKIFQAMNVAAASANRALTPLEQSTQDLADANLRLATAQSVALKGDNYIDFSRKMQLFWTDIKTTFYNGITFITDFYTKSQDFLISNIVSLVTTAQHLPSILTKGIKDVATAVLDTVKSLGGLGDVITKLISFDFSGAKESAIKFKDDFKSSFGEIKESAGDTIKEIIATRAVAQQLALEEINRNRAGNIASVNASIETNDPTVNPNNGNNLEGDKESTAKQKAFEESEKAYTKIIADEIERRRLLSLSDQDRELAQIDKKYADSLQKYQDNEDRVAELTALRDEEKADLKLKNAQELQERLNTLEQENETAKEDLEFEKELLKTQTDEEKAMLMLERTQFLADEQLRIEEEKELKRLELVNATEEEIAAIKEKYAIKKLQLEFQFDRAKQKAEETAAKNEKTINNQRLNEYSSLFGNIATLLGKNTAAGKAAAVAQATMNTYQGITNVWAAKSVLPEPLGTAQKVISTGIVLASGLSAVKQIGNTQVKGYEQGLYPVTRQQDGKQFNASYSNDTSTRILNDPTILAGERPEMIIDPNTFKAMDPKVVDYILQLAGKRPIQGFETGDYSKQTNTSSAQISEETNSATINNETLNATIGQLTEVLQRGIKAKIFFGLEEEISRQEVEDKLNAINKASKN